jgi:hypothetical protein
MARMTDVRTAHTSDLDAATLEAARALLYDVFDDMTDQDWEHALGGVHALAWEGAELVGHASVISGAYCTADEHCARDTWKVSVSVPTGVVMVTVEP